MLVQGFGEMRQWTFADGWEARMGSLQALRAFEQLGLGDESRAMAVLLMNVNLKSPKGHGKDFVVFRSRATPFSLASPPRAAA